MPWPTVFLVSWQEIGIIWYEIMRLGFIVRICPIDTFLGSDKTTPSASGTDIKEILDRFHVLTREEKTPKQAVSDVAKEIMAEDLEKRQHRDWKVGDVYAPKDIGPFEMVKWFERKAPTQDIFDTLAIDPLHEYKVIRSLLVCLKVIECILI